MPWPADYSSKAERVMDRLEFGVWRLAFLNHKVSKKMQLCFSE